MNKELEDLHGFPPEIPKEISDKVESMMDKLDNIDIHEDLAKNFEDMRNTGNLITLTPPIDRVQYGINIEAIKEGEWYINPSNEIKQSKFDFNPTTEKKINFSTNPKDTRFPYLVIPSKEQEVDVPFHKDSPAYSYYMRGFNANPAKYTQEEMVGFMKFFLLHKQSELTDKIAKQAKDRELKDMSEEIFDLYLQSLQPTAKAVRVEMEAIYLRTEGEGHSSNSYGIYEDRIKVETSSEYPQGFVKALEVIY